MADARVTEIAWPHQRPGWSREGDSGRIVDRQANAGSRIPRRPNQEFIARRWAATNDELESVSEKRIRDCAATRQGYRLPVVESSKAIGCAVERENEIPTINAGRISINDVNRTVASVSLRAEDCWWSDGKKVRAKAAGVDVEIKL